MTTRIIIFVILELIVLYTLFGSYLRRKLASPRRRLRLSCRDYANHINRIIRHDRDLLAPTTRTDLEQLREQARQASRDPALNQSELGGRIKEIERKSQRIMAGYPGKSSWLSEITEVMVVALALAFGFRAFALQPFKIPTGSMEPTLYGIHFVETQEMRDRSLPRRVFDYIHFSNRYVDQVVRRSGYYEGARPASELPLLSSTVVRIAGLDYTLPGDLEAVKKQVDRIREFENRNLLYQRNLGHGNMVSPPSPPHFEAGEVLTRGWLRSGDHVFVNRLSQNFSELKHGDIVVFLTDNLRDPQGQPLRGRHFIKRLVGMPGDRLRIDQDNRLLIQPAGTDRFVLMDDSFAPAFNHIYSGFDGYHGFIADMPSAKYSLSTPYTVPDNHYFMLGDNSAFSQDSRYWGPVPRGNIIGRATIAWWPLSRRWGIIDKAEPRPIPTKINSFPGRPIE